MADEVNNFIESQMTDEEKAFCERQAEKLQNSVLAKVARVKEKVRRAWKEVESNLDERMEEMAERGYCGFEFYEHPYLGHPSFTQFFAEIFAQLGVQGKYMLFYHVKTCTVSVVFNKNFMKRDSLVIGDYDDGGRPIAKAVTYTTTQEAKKKYKKFKEKTQKQALEIEKMRGETDELKKKLNEVYYAPGMPGYILGNRSFELGQKQRRNSG